MIHLKKCVVLELVLVTAHTKNRYIIFIIIVTRSGVLIYFSLTVKVATLIFISGCGSAISSAKEGKSGFIYNLVKS